MCRPSLLLGAFWPGSVSSEARRSPPGGVGVVRRFFVSPSPAIGSSRTDAPGGPPQPQRQRARKGLLKGGTDTPALGPLRAHGVHSGGRRDSRSQQSKY